jgi:hypothetical protein
MLALPAAPLLALVALVGLATAWPGTWWAIGFGLTGVGVLVLCEIKE